MKIAIMGIRGIPANYGGFETFAEHLAPSLVKLGHTVTVYGRSNNITCRERMYKGVRLVVLPTISHKYLDTVVHTFLSVCHGVVWGNYDVILVCNSANSLFTIIPRLRGQKVVCNVNGLEWRRKKWNALGRLHYKVSEFLATILPNEVVTDARCVHDYYRTKYRKETTLIPYGADSESVPPGETLNQFGLERGEYVLYVSRLEPENNAHRVVKAFERVRTDKRLVIVGDAPYSTDYIRNLKATKDPRILFTGYVFGQGYKELQSNAYFYVQATEVGGTHPALLEGMALGDCVLANDVPEHREVLGRAGYYFSPTDDDHLRAQMQMLIDAPSLIQDCRRFSQAQIAAKFTWSQITRDYESLFYRTLRMTPPAETDAPEEKENERESEPQQATGELQEAATN